MFLLDEITPRNLALEQSELSYQSHRCKKHLEDLHQKYQGEWYPYNVLFPKAMSQTSFYPNINPHLLLLSAPHYKGRAPNITPIKQFIPPRCNNSEQSGPLNKGNYHISQLSDTGARTPWRSPPEISGRVIPLPRPLHEGHESHLILSKHKPVPPPPQRAPITKV